MNDCPCCSRTQFVRSLTLHEAAHRCNWGASMSHGTLPRPRTFWILLKLSCSEALAVNGACMIADDRTQSISRYNDTYRRFQTPSMAAALPSVVRTLADRARPVATHTSAALAAPLSCANPQARLISRSIAHFRQTFLPASIRSPSAFRRRSAVQHLTCMASSQVQPPILCVACNTAHKQMQPVILWDVDWDLNSHQSCHSPCRCPQPFTIVGSGRVGRALADLGAGDDVRRLEGFMCTTVTLGAALY